MPFCIQYLKSNGQICADIDTRDAKPPVIDPKGPVGQLVIDKPVTVDGKTYAPPFNRHGMRVNLALQRLEKCPVTERKEARAALLRKLDELDAKTPRALREHALTGDTAALQKIEDAAQPLRDQLQALPDMDY